jgi:hypothetical protein
MIPEQGSITGMECAATGSALGALSQFYQAFNVRNLELMRKNWHPQECVLDNPLGGMLRGWNEIEPLYRRLFDGSARVKVVFHDYTLHQGADLFCAVGRERGSYENGNVKFALAIRTTRIFRLADGVWRQIHHHGSIEEPELLAQYKAAVLGN